MTRLLLEAHERGEHDHVGERVETCPGCIAADTEARHDQGLHDHLDDPDCETCAEVRRAHPTF